MQLAEEEKMEFSGADARQPCGPVWALPRPAHPTGWHLNSGLQAAREGARGRAGLLPQGAGAALATYFRFLHNRLARVIKLKDI